LVIADFVIADCRLRLAIEIGRLSIEHPAQNPQSPISIINPQSENRQSSIRNPQSTESLVLFRR